jgi:protoporphyrinogen oxidase
MNVAGSHSEPSWCVVGGGMLGLALARRLADAGCRVTLMEAGPEIGGLAGAWKIGDAEWDRFYHVTLLSDERLRQLIGELGLTDEMRWVETKTGFYTDGRLHSMSTSIEFLKFPPLGLIDKLRLGLTIFAASKITNWRRLEGQLVGDWLRRWSGERTFRRIWEPLLLAKLGECYRRTAASFIWATIQRMYRARRTGLKKEMFGYVRGGYRRILSALADDLQARGVEVRTNCRVAEVSSDDAGPLVRTAEGAERFDRVVLTAPSPIAVELCPQLSEAERRRHEQIEYLGIVCASVLLDRPLASYYVTNITDPGLPYTAVIEMTTLVDPAELGGQSLVYLPRYAAADDPAWKWTDAEVEERFLAGLASMYGDFRREHVRAVRIARARHVMALPTRDYSAKLPPVKSDVPGVFVANSAHIVKGTLNVNEILELADEMFESTLAADVRDSVQRVATAAMAPHNSRTAVPALEEAPA